MLTKITLAKLVDTPIAGDKKPSHAIVASDSNYQNKTTIGKLWLKSGERGNFLSGQLDVEREHEGKVYDGYVIITQKEYNKLKNPSVEVGGYTGEVADINEIDF